MSDDPCSSPLPQLCSQLCAGRQARQACAESLEQRAGLPSSLLVEGEPADQIPLHQLLLAGRLGGPTGDGEGTGQGLLPDGAIEPAVQSQQINRGCPPCVLAPSASTRIWSSSASSVDDVALAPVRCARARSWAKLSRLACGVGLRRAAALGAENGRELPLPPARARLAS